MFDNTGATWIDSDHYVKRSKVNLWDEVLQVQVTLNVACGRVLAVSDIVGDYPQRVDKKY